MGSGTRMELLLAVSTVAIVFKISLEKETFFGKETGKANHLRCSKEVIF